MTTPAPTVGGRVIGLAHYASRAVLEQVLDPHGLTFLRFVTLRLTALADGPVETDRLVGEVVDAVKIDAADAHGAVAELIGAGLVTPREPSGVLVTDAGRELHARASAETAAVSARIYDGIPAQDRAAAGRVLALVTERANAELAASRR
ncbi:MarR family winged helix-turn-helix transcriptional regulator [Streptomyces sp. NPDC002514]|uniref:MarR family winged helix-turn-helix transcriptional regulator n=1 Tax=Streptomyces sp. NPDC001270 TaxID=3364554 RepID=UPI0036C7B679